MVKYFLSLIYVFATVASPAYSLDFTEMTKEIFDTKVVGKTWLHASIDSTLKIQSDGSVTVDAPRGKFVGKYEFIDGKGFCREGDFAGTKVPYACEEVKLIGERIFVFFNKRKPDGDPYILLTE